MAIKRTINRLVRSILSDILGVYNPEDTISAADANTILEFCQDKLAEWSEGGIYIPVPTTDCLPLVPGKVSYIIGQAPYPVPDVGTLRPDLITRVMIRDSNTYDYPCNILTKDLWENLLDKTQTTGRPERMYPEYSVPNIKVYFNPIPDVAYTARITSMKPLTQPNFLTDDVFSDLLLPGQIYQALKWNVAMDVAEGFSKSVTPIMQKNAMATEGKMLALNLARSIQGTVMDLAPTGQRFNILTGSY